MGKSDLAKSPNCFQQEDLKTGDEDYFSVLPHRFFFCPTDGAARIDCNNFFLPPYYTSGCEPMSRHSVEFYQTGTFERTLHGLSYSAAAQVRKLT